jgi:cytoskeletal protein RodZ
MSAVLICVHLQRLAAPAPTTPTVTPTTSTTSTESKALHVITTSTTPPFIPLVLGSGVAVSTEAMNQTGEGQSFERKQGYNVPNIATSIAAMATSGGIIAIGIADGTILFTYVLHIHLYNVMCYV